MLVTALRSLFSRISKSVHFMFPLQDEVGVQGDGLVSQALGAQA